MSSVHAIISDVHANMEALQAVLEAIGSDSSDSILFLGDIVGYGPDPDRCISLLKESSRFMIAGNHDRAATGQSDTGRFNPYARAAMEWTVNVLTSSNKEFLRGLSLTETLSADSIFLVHGTPREPHKWHYLSDESRELIQFDYFTEQVCLVGHSHKPFILELDADGEMKVYSSFAKIKKQNRYIVNAGSVGQPRDGNPDASYALISRDRIAIKRVPYDIVITQKKIKKAGLPEFLAERLSTGR